MDLLSYADQLPQCGLTCLLEQVPISPCGSLTNTTCICANNDLYLNTQDCLASACETAVETIEVARIEAEVCERPHRDRKAHLLAPLAVEIPALFAVWLRLYARWDAAHKFEADDWIMLVCGILYTPFLVIGQAAGMIAFGEDIWNVSQEDMTMGLKLFYIDESFYLVCLALTKISILCFFLRIFPNRGFRAATHATMVLVGVATTTFVLMQIFQCTPIEYNWQGWKGHFDARRCLDINTLAYLAAGFSIAQDVIILALPLPLLYGLRVSRRTKAGIMFMFSLGIFILITSCIRLRYMVLFARSANPTWDYADALIWSGLEVAVSIIITSLPALRVLFGKMLPSLIGGFAARWGFRFCKKTPAAVAGTGESNHEHLSPPLSRQDGLKTSNCDPFSASGRMQANESQLELGEKTRGDVCTEIGVCDDSCRDADDSRRSSLDSGIHVQTTTRVNSTAGV